MSVFFESVALVGQQQHTLQRMATHPREYGQHNLHLMELKNIRRPNSVSRKEGLGLG